MVFAVFACWKSMRAELRIDAPAKAAEPTRLSVFDPIDALVELVFVRGLQTAWRT